MKNFSIINQVAAVSLDARLDCNKFADAHSSDAHFDRNSFVGLAWRPANESICCEIYSTGKANLPGSTRERDCFDSWTRMLPEMLRFSSNRGLLNAVPRELTETQPSDDDNDDEDKGGDSNRHRARRTSFDDASATMFSFMDNGGLSDDALEMLGL